MCRMNDVKEVSTLIYSKMKIQISNDKALHIINLINKYYPNMSFEAALADVNKMVILPAWITQAVTINETFFFRHPEHFVKVKDFIKNNSKSELKLLCLGCSTGEESYSLAMAVEESIKPGIKYSIAAVDIDQNCIKTAKLGLYNANDGKRVSEQWKKTFDKYTAKIQDHYTEKFQMSDLIKSKIQYSCSDIFQFVYDRYDIIFVRNILIYFPENDKVTIYKKLASRLNTDGLIFIGAAELIPDGSKEFVRTITTSILQKVG